MLNVKTSKIMSKQPITLFRLPQYPEMVPNARGRQMCGNNATQWNLNPGKWINYCIEDGNIEKVDKPTRNHRKWNTSHSAQGAFARLLMVQCCRLLSWKPKSCNHRWVNNSEPESCDWGIVGSKGHWLEQWKAETRGTGQNHDQSSIT